MPGESTICPSVMYPVRSGTGWVMSPAGMVSTGTTVTEPGRPRMRPQRSYSEARSLYR